MKSKLKNNLSKGIAGLSLMALPYCSSNSQDLPIYEKEVISSMKNSQQELLNKSKDYILLAREKIYNSAKDFYIDTLEQKDIKNYYDSAKSLVKVYNSRNLSKTEIFSDKDNKYYNALKKNLQRIDLGRPKLEKIIKRDIGYNIKVQKYYSNKEKSWLIGIAGFGALFVLSALACSPLLLLDN
jgi:hypothetical protein